MTALNNVQTSNIINLSDLSVRTLPESNNNKLNEFLGFLPITKQRQYFSEKRKHIPWQSDALPEDWLLEEGLSDQTIQFRKNFKTFLQASLNFDFYQLRPVKIPFTNKSKRKQLYQPLALLTYRNDEGFPFTLPNLLIDIWCNEDIERNKSILHPAFRAANHFALSRKLNFQVYRDKFFQSDYFTNLAFIKRFVTQTLEEDNQRLIMKIFREKHIINLSKLIELFNTNDANHLGRLVRDVWILVSWGLLKTDWQMKFHKNTVLWL